ncbi:MAG: DNA damage-inducible protein D [Chromatiales bacterium]|nr:DNA damage-inducible protein D [Gammaproteobacteria bacterium]
MNKEVTQHHQTFESLKHRLGGGVEFWTARELQAVLDYSRWEKFERVIKKAMAACKKSGQAIEDHFPQMVNMVQIGSGARRKTKDYKLSRYACYLIVQNGDPAKPVIANGQTYFAIQTRRKELEDDAGFQGLTEDKKRLMLRNELATHNKQLAAAAKDAGVETGLDYAIFQNHGYKGLYGGLDNKAIHQRKGLKKSQKILDHMGSTEMAANLFRATQTGDKLKRDDIKGKASANKTHYEVGAKVRQTITELGGAMPEDLSTPDKGIKQLRNSQKKLERDE